MDAENVKTLIENADAFTETYLGSRESTVGIEENVGVGDEQRMTHVLNIGPTGYGKTQLMIHAALQDAEKGHGFCMVNPKGGAIDEILAKLPEDRREDVIYLNPNRTKLPAINVLEPHITAAMTAAERDNQKEIIISDLIDVFKRLSESWGDRFGRVLETLLRAHLDLNINRNERNTLMDVFECVINEDTLTELIDRTNNPIIRKQLVRIRELSQRELDPLHRRLDDFIQNETVRKVITQPESSINVRELMDEGNILLVDVQKGTLGDTASALIGSILITKVWAAAQSRITLPEDERRPFYLYIDELQNFASEGSNFAKILSEAREYKLGCYLASQYLGQLSTEMRRAVTNNCRTKIFFNPAGSEDVPQIVGMLRGVDAEQLTALGKYRAVVQTPTERSHQSAVVFDTYPPWIADTSTAEGIKDAVCTDYPALVDHTTDMTPETGTTANAGGEFHAELLKAAQDQFTAQGAQVNLLYQDAGDEKPDGTILGDGEITNLEAEHSTLTKPVKVLTNYKRAVEQDRECVFVVEWGNATKLANIVEDPVNRRGTEHEDEDGSFDYYRHDGEAFTDVELLADGEYRIFEVRDDETLVEHDAETDAECPELEHNERESLESFCIYRDEDGYCSEIGQQCVVTDD